MRLDHSGLAAGLLALFVAAPVPGQDTEALFQRVKAHMAEHRDALPNYTCHETVSSMGRTGSQWRYLDKLDLEVAFAGHQEIFSKAGSDRFGAQSVEEIAGGGTIGNSALGSHTDSILFQDGIAFKYAGAGKKDGRKTIRYDFSVPTEVSRFLVRHDGAEAVAGYDGSIWFDAESLDPVRIDLKVNRIPTNIKVRRIEESLHYKKVPIGKSEFALPEHSVLSARDDADNDTLNLTNLSRCREFTSDSVVKYASPTPGGGARDDH